MEDALRPPEVEITIDHEHHRSPQESTGLALYELGRIPPDFLFFQETPEPQEDKVIPRNEQRIQLHEHEKFYSSHETRIVQVTVDNVKKDIPKGQYVVAVFKQKVGVDASRALDEVVAGEFKPLQDDQRIRIHGGEVFISHVRQGGSS
jgi:hypothetical protein